MTCSHWSPAKWTCSRHDTICYHWKINRECRIFCSLIFKDEKPRHTSVPSEFIASATFISTEETTSEFSVMLAEVFPPRPRLNEFSMLFFTEIFSLIGRHLRLSKVLGCDFHSRRSDIGRSSREWECEYIRSNSIEKSALLIMHAKAGLLHRYQRGGQRGIYISI